MSMQGNGMGAEHAAPAFGPSALATPANAITALRLLLAPVLFSMILDDVASWPAFAMWVVLAGSDGIDGWVARRMGTTRSGAFLDPLADKVLVIGALVCLVAVDRFSWVPVSVIAVREIAVSFYRSWFGRQGLAIPARPSAKAKTFVQTLAIGFAIAPATEDLTWIADGLLWLAVVLSVVSAVQYFHDGGRAATDMARAD